MRTDKVTEGPHYDADATMVVPQPYSLLETDITSYFPRKISWVIGKLFLAVSTFVKEIDHSLAEHFLKPVNILNNVNANYLKIPKIIADRTKRPRGSHAARGHMRPWSRLQS